MAIHLEKAFDAPAKTWMQRQLDYEYAAVVQCADEIKVLPFAGNSMSPEKGQGAIAEYQCDVTHRGQKEALAEFLPHDAMNWITCGNALRMDWLSIYSPTGTGVKMHGDNLFSTLLDQVEIDFENEGGETYICGNPPYAGKGKKTPQEIDDMEFAFG